MKLHHLQLQGILIITVNLTYKLNPEETMQELMEHTLMGASGHEIDIYLTTAGHLWVTGPVRVTGLRCCPQGELLLSGGYEVRHRMTQAHHRPPDAQYGVVTSSVLGVTADMSVSADNSMRVASWRHLQRVWSLTTHC